MKMYFHADIGIDYILVQDWKPSTGEGKKDNRFLF